VVHLPEALVDSVRGNLGSGCLQADVAKLAALPNNHHPYSNAKPLLVSIQYPFSYNLQIKWFRTC
jgi:hypothetical protein